MNKTKIFENTDNSFSVFLFGGLVLNTPNLSSYFGLFVDFGGGGGELD